MDPRGLQSLGISAADDLSGPVGNSHNPLVDAISPAEWTRGIDSDLQKRSVEFFKTQQGLGYLAKQTGGAFVRNTNDLNGAVRRVLNEQKGYYLLGYRPDETTVKAAGRRQEFPLTLSGIIFSKPSLNATTTIEKASATGPGPAVDSAQSIPPGTSAPAAADQPPTTHP